jgi:hypothetical protein
MGNWRGGRLPEAPGSNGLFGGVESSVGGAATGWAGGDPALGTRKPPRSWGGTGSPWGADPGSQQSNPWASGGASSNRSNPWSAPGGAAGGAPPEGRAGVLSDPGTGEGWNDKYGKELTETPGYGEDLYKQGIGALNPYYDYASQQAEKSINRGSAARGNFNSSYTMKLLGDTEANLRGQQAKDMAGLAAEADRERLSRYGAGFGAASGAQGLEQDRVTGAVRDAIAMATGRSGLTKDFYGNIQKIDATQLAAIEAQLKASGMDAAKVAGIMNTLGQIAGLGVKAYGISQGVPQGVP